jgi:hypothetical protein
VTVTVIVRCDIESWCGLMNIDILSILSEFCFLAIFGPFSAKKTKFSQKMDSRSPPVSPAASNLLKRMYRMRGTAGSSTSRRTGAVGVLFVDNESQGPRTRTNGHNDETIPFTHQTRYHKTTRLVNQNEPYHRQRYNMGMYGHRCV